MFTGTTLALQRVRKLQEQAAIADDVVARIQTGGNLGLPLKAFSQRDRSPAKLVCVDLSVNKRLILAVAQYGRVW
jgi:hypothetical protein